MMKVTRRPNRGRYCEALPRPKENTKPPALNKPLKPQPPTMLVVTELVINMLTSLLD